MNIETTEGHEIRRLYHLRMEDVEPSEFDKMKFRCKLQLPFSKFSITTLYNFLQVFFLYINVEKKCAFHS